MSARRPGLLRYAHGWLSQIADPVRAVRAARSLVWYWRDYRAYRRHPDAEPISWRDLEPALHEHGGAHQSDAHYFHLNAWAMRRIVAERPHSHVDVASQAAFVSLLSAVVPSVFIDYRPLLVPLRGLSAVAANLLALPCRDGSIESLSCLHVAEHVGLGRYGDPLEPLGTRRATAELARVLAPGGSLFFAVPVGQPRVAFNAHRVHAPERIVEYFESLQLVEFSGVDDRGQYYEHCEPHRLAGERYGCGFYHFRKTP